MANLSDSASNSWCESASAVSNDPTNQNSDSYDSEEDSPVKVCLDAAPDDNDSNKSFSGQNPR